LLVKAPLFAAAMSFWFFGNYQMFVGQKTDALLTLTSIVPSHHTVGETFSRILTFGLSMNENLLLITFIAVSGIFALI